MALQIDELAKATLDTLIAKEPIELNNANIAFLKARREYLNAKQLEKFKDILKSKAPRVKEAGSTPEEILAGRNVLDLSYKELQKINKALGLPYVGVSAASLRETISTKLGPPSAGNPD